MSAFGPEFSEEAKLFKNSKERERYDNQADLYAIITTLQCLEKANIKDLVNPKEYTAQCLKLLTQYKSSFRLVKSAEVPDVETFAHKFHMDCPAAITRINEARPENIKNPTDNFAKTVLNVTSSFITLADSCKIQGDIPMQRDQVRLDMHDLEYWLLSIPSLPENFPPKKMISKWMLKLEDMTDDDLPSEDVKVLSFDLELAYKQWDGFLENMGKD